MTFKRALDTDLCCVENCEKPRHAPGNYSGRSRYCHEHYKAHNRSHKQGKRQNAGFTTPAQSMAEDVYAAWGKGQSLGIVAYDGRRVYGITPMEGCYRMLVDGMEHVLLSGRTMLTVGGYPA